MNCELILGISLETLKEMIAEKSGRELPDITPFIVHESLIAEFVSKWKPICLNSFSDVESLLEDWIEPICKKHFVRFRSSGLLRLVE
jgi:hypothetical protein